MVDNWLLLGAEKEGVEVFEDDEEEEEEEDDDDAKGAEQDQSGKSFRFGMGRVLFWPVLVFVVDGVVVVMEEEEEIFPLEVPSVPRLISLLLWLRWAFFFLLLVVDDFLFPCGIVPNTTILRTTVLTLQEKSDNRQQDDGLGVCIYLLLLERVLKYLYYLYMSTNWHRK